MGLDIMLLDPTSTYKTEFLYSDNITHNLGEMAEKAGIYKHLWRPEELGFTIAKEVIKGIERGLKDMKERSDYYKQFNSSNSFGIYNDFIPFIENYLKACKEFPKAIIEVNK